jgi:hypothetical protein
MRGTDPGIDVREQSIQVMDCRVKPGKDVRITFHQATRARDLTSQAGLRQSKVRRKCLFRALPFGPGVLYWGASKE